MTKSLLPFTPAAHSLPIETFLSEYSPSLYSLIDALDEAHISHYSSCIGIQGIAFEIFPASRCVEELLQLLTLERPHMPQSAGHLRDASSKSSYNPAHDFAAFLKRWNGFCQQVMRMEGETPRGIAAARAKLIMDDLAHRLNAGKAAQDKTVTTAFSRLMQSIGLTLEARTQETAQRQSEYERQQMERNYARALAAAGENSQKPMPPIREAAVSSARQAA